jgi:hypothetical protein
MITKFISNCNELKTKMQILYPSICTSEIRISANYNLISSSLDEKKWNSVIW